MTYLVLLAQVDEGPDVGCTRLLQPGPDQILLDTKKIIVKGTVLRMPLF
jgi:hypothetical protein